MLIFESIVLGVALAGAGALAIVAENRYQRAADPMRGHKRRMRQRRRTRDRRRARRVIT